MTTVNPGTSQQAVVEAALVLLERMGLSPADLAAVPQARKPVPTFAEYVPVVSAAVSAGTRRAYGSYWNRIVEHWGSRRLDEPTPSEIRQLMVYVKDHVIARRNARGGRSAQEHLVAALRCLYRRAVDDGLITEADNPARKVAKPRRLPTTRRALPDARLAEINQIAATTGDDPELDTLILRLHTETACRRGGALALRPRDLDQDQCLVLLREKGETVRWQPVSATLMARLVEHGRERHASPDGQLLRYADGRPITSRRYDHLWRRIGRHLPWVATQGISTHWIRHTILTWLTPFRLRGRPGLRRPRRPRPGRKGHGNLCPRGPPRGSDGTCRPDQRGSSTSGQRARPKNTNPGPGCMTMPKTDRGTGRPPESAYRLPEDGPLPDLPLYERLIDDGIAAADSRDSPVDHLTARRLAIWLAARPQPPVFAQSLVHFVNTGAISPALKAHLRIHARSGNYPDRPEAARLMQYCVARGADPGPIGENFGTACDQIDRADAMLAVRYQRAKDSRAQPKQDRPKASEPQITALAHPDPETQTVTFILDATTANTVMFAIAAHADEREAHIREVEQLGQRFPEGSFGRRNRQAIAAREMRVATRLRAVERAYRTAPDRGPALEPPELNRAWRSPGHTADREIELE